MQLRVQEMEPPVGHMITNRNMLNVKVCIIERVHL